MPPQEMHADKRLDVLFMLDHGLIESLRPNPYIGHAVDIGEAEIPCELTVHLLFGDFA